jgi:hypothetical protein
MNMHENIRPSLNAYLDGELHGTRLQEIEIHLASCEFCRKELEELRLVSHFVKSAPAPDFMPADRFASNLILRLPRREWSALPLRSHSLAWWLVPAGLLGAWFFVQTVFALSHAVQAAAMTGMLGQVNSILTNGQQTLWFATLTGMSGWQAAELNSAFSLLNAMNIFSVNLLENFLWQALIVLLYWGWLIAWWFYQRPRHMQAENVS